MSSSFCLRLGLSVCLGLGAVRLCGELSPLGELRSSELRSKSSSSSRCAMAYSARVRSRPSCASAATIWSNCRQPFLGSQGRRPAEGKGERRVRVQLQPLPVQRSLSTLHPRSERLGEVEKAREEPWKRPRNTASSRWKRRAWPRSAKNSVSSISSSLFTSTSCATA